MPYGGLLTSIDAVASPATSTIRPPTLPHAPRDPSETVPKGIFEAPPSTPGAAAKFRQLLQSLLPSFPPPCLKLPWSFGEDTMLLAAILQVVTLKRVAPNAAVELSPEDWGLVASAVGQFAAGTQSAAPAATPAAA